MKHSGTRKNIVAQALLSQMEFALVLRELARRRRTVALGVVVAAIAAVFSVYRLDGTNLKPRSLEYSSATTQVLIDAKASVLGNVSQSFEPLANRAVVYANFMTSPAVLDLIGQQVGLSGEQIYAAGPVSAAQPRVEQEPTALRRNVEITGETKPYRLNFESQGTLPTITINAQAPTTKVAIALADAAASGMQRYINEVEDANNVPQGSRVAIRQLGPASGSIVDPGVRKSLAGLVFIVVLGLWCVMMIVLSRFRASWKASGGALLAESAADAQPPLPRGSTPEAAPVPVAASTADDPDELESLTWDIRTATATAGGSAPETRPERAAPEQERRPAPVRSLRWR